MSQLCKTHEVIHDGDECWLCLRIQRDALREVAEQVEPVLDNIIGELMGTGPATKWGPVNDLLCNAKAALALVHKEGK